MVSFNTASVLIQPMCGDWKDVSRFRFNTASVLIQPITETEKEEVS